MAMLEPPKPIYRRKRTLLVSVLLLGLVLVGWHYRAVAGFLKETAVAAVAYAEKAGPMEAGLILGVVSMADSSFLSIPQGVDFLVVSFAILRSSWLAWFVLAGTVGSTLGCLILFLAARQSGGALLRRRFSPERVRAVENWFRKYDVWAVMVPCIMPPPMPFKLFVLTAGVLRVGVVRFILAVAIGRVVRYGAWGLLAILFKDTVQHLFRHHLLEFGLALLGGLVLLTLAAWLWRRLLHRPSLALSPVEPVISGAGSVTKPGP